MESVNSVWIDLDDVFTLLGDKVITYKNVDLFSVGPSGTNLIEISLKVQTF